MKPLTPSMVRAISSAREFRYSADEFLDYIRELLEDSDCDLFHSMSSWVAESLSLDNPVSTFPDRGIFLSFLCTVMSLLFADNISDVDYCLRCFHTMFSDLRSQFFPASPQKNLFHIHDSVASTLDFTTSQLRRSSHSAPHPSSSHSVSSSSSAPLFPGRSSTNSFSPPLNDLDALSLWLAEERSVLPDHPLYLCHLHEAQHWKSVLQKILSHADDLALATITESIVSVIQEMKDVPKRTFSSPPFRRAIRDSDLTFVFESICNLSFILINRNAHLLRIEHLYRVADQLAEILDSWTPNFISKTWDVSPAHFISSTSGSKHILDPNDLIKLFDDNPSNVPGEENLSFSFFMSSFDNFRYNYNRWLAIFLENKDYDITGFNDVQSLENFYTRLMSLIHHWCSDFQYTRDGVRKLIIDIKHFDCERWRTIIKKTAWLRKLHNICDHRAYILTCCKHCSLLPSHLRCCQYIFMPHITNGLSPEDARSTLSTLANELKGSGVSMVPLHDCIRPNNDTDPAHPDHHCYPGTLFHPDSVGTTNPITLRGLEPDPDIIAHCGHQLLLVLNEHRDPSITNQSIVDWKTARDKKIIDFIWFGAFDNEMLSILQDNVVESTGVQAVKHGGQFQTFTSGKMVPVGSRIPSGGRPGDSYTSYSGLEASSQNGLDILFNQAATSVIMTSTAKLAHPELAHDLSLLSADCDRIGMTGANIFNCTGYLAPIHSDNDATRGLCVQALLHADSSYREFSFCNIEYQYYIVTSTNCLWSFHSKNLHGTMLPSALTVQNLNSHAVDPRRVSSTNVPSSSSTSASSAPNPPNSRPRRRPHKLIVAGSQIQQRRTRSTTAGRPSASVTVSNGAHVAVPNRNQLRASQNARRREQFHARSALWRRQ
ncbi:hypothetical protein EV360DRAFT_88447 [Lentinula raphanica]|nr:hypothetical protein EV360DRAFT_88447 [Lentinula raphanica]